MLDTLKIKIGKSSKLWHQEACKHAFNNQSISRDAQFAKMHAVFVDSEGRKYFSYLSMDDCPLPRYEQLQITLQELDNRISYTDLDLFADTILKIANDEKRKTKVTDLGSMALALKKRRELLYEPELMFKMCSILYIREDQDPAVWDEDLEKGKIEQFKKDSRAGLYDFFYSAGLRNYLPGSTQSKSESMQLQELENQTEQIAEFQKLLAILQQS